MSKKQRILFLIPSSDLIPSGKVRILNYLPYLDSYSIKSKIMNYHHPIIIKLRESLNPKGRVLLFLYRILKKCLQGIDFFYQRWIEIRLLISSRRYPLIVVQWEPPPRPIMTWLLKRNPNLIFDFDDTVFLDPKLNTDFILANSKVIIAGSEYLKNYAKTLYENVVVIPSSVPIEKFDLYRDESHWCKDSRIVIGWIGSPSTLHHIEILRDVFDILEKKYELQLKLIGTGNEKCPIKGKAHLEIVTVNSYNEDEMIHYAFSFDIGIVPLKETKVALGKTSLKALIYMAAGVPLVCSPVGENLKLVIEGVNGFFAYTAEDWVEKLSLLIQNKHLRRKIGEEGLSLVRERYTTQLCFKLFYETIKSNFLEYE